MNYFFPHSSFRPVVRVGCHLRAAGEQRSEPRAVLALLRGFPPHSRQAPAALHRALRAQMPR
jgi:hypothetical protein